MRSGILRSRDRRLSDSREDCTRIIAVVSAIIESSMRWPTMTALCMLITSNTEKTCIEVLNEESEDRFTPRPKPRPSGGALLGVVPSEAKPSRGAMKWVPRALPVGTHSAEAFLKHVRSL